MTVLFIRPSQALKIGFLLSLTLSFSWPPSLWAGLDEDLATLTKKVQESRQQISGCDLDNIEAFKKDLALMVSLDQEVRGVFMKNINDERVRDLMAYMDRFYTNHMKAMLHHHPWITISKFGAEADHQAWLLVQHADHDLDFQRHCLKILEGLLPDQETNPHNYAYLYDRVALKEGRKQRYGTQVRIEGAQFNLFPMEEKVESYRQEVGLGPLEEYLDNLKTMYSPEHERQYHYPLRNP